MKEIQKLKILICEEDSRVLQKLKSWITTISEDVVGCPDGIKAIKIYNELRPDILVVSQNIKSIHGIELIEKVKKISVKQAIVFMVSDDLVSLKRAIELQVDRYLNSPVKVKPLLDAINSLAQEKLWHDEFKNQKKLLEDYKDAINLSFSVSRHDKKGNILYVNDLFCITTKLQYEDAMRGVINPLNNPNTDILKVWDVLKKDFLYKDRQIFKLENKTEHIIDITAVALKNDSGEVYEYLVFSNDVSEIVYSQRKIKNQELEQRLIKLNHTKELNRVKDSFLTIFTHELKTPLNAIINFSEYVYKHLQKEDFAKKIILSPQVQEINNSGLFLLEMINNLMEATKLRDSKISIEVTDVNIQNTLKNIVNEYNSKSNLNPIILTCENDIEILSDYNHFSQIFKNIISNAVKYAQKTIMVKILKNENTFLVSVEDDGKGFITTENVFDIFEQSDVDSMTREATGTGVGLFIVKQLCDRMEYKIHIETSPGLGGAKASIEGNREIN